MDKLSLNGYLKKVVVDTKTKENYRKRYEEIRDKIATRWFHVRSTNRMVVHLRIPSEQVKMFYDVLVEFPFGKDSGTYKNFHTDSIRVYSNCPSFVYMNARVFDRKGFLIPWAKPLYSKETLEPPPKEKMAEELQKDVKYEKSLYFTALYFNELNAIQVLSAIREATSVPHVEAVLQYMRTPEKTMEVRSKKQDKQKAKVAKQKVVVSKNGIEVLKKADKPGKIGAIAKIKKTSSVNKTKHI